MNLKHGLTLACLFTAAFVVTGCNGGGSEVATVNNVAISEQDFNDYLSSKNSMNVDPNGFASQQALQASIQRIGAGQPIALAGTAGFQALRDLVIMQVTLQLAKEQGFDPTQDKVDAEVKYQKDLDDNFIKMLQEQRGMSMDQIRKQIAVDLARQALVTKGITVTDQDVDDFIKEAKQSQNLNLRQQFVDMGRADLQWIQVSTPAQQKAVDDALAKGQKFKDVALQYSEDPGKDQKQAALTQDPKGVVTAGLGQLQPVIEATDVNKTTNWVKDGNKFDKFYVVSKSKDKDKEITKTLREFARRQIATSRGNQGKDVGQDIMNALLNAKVEIKQSAFKSMWTQYFNNLKSSKEQKDAQSNAASMPQSATGDGAGTAPAGTTGN